MGYQYRVVRAATAPQLENELNDVAQEGYRVVQVTTLTLTHVHNPDQNFLCAVMEREAHPSDDNQV